MTNEVPPQVQQRAIDKLLACRLVEPIVWGVTEREAGRTPEEALELCRDLRQAKLKESQVGGRRGSQKRSHLEREFRNAAGVKYETALTEVQDQLEDMPETWLMLAGM